MQSRHIVARAISFLGLVELISVVPGFQEYGTALVYTISNLDSQRHANL